LGPSNVLEVGMKLEMESTQAGARGVSIEGLRRTLMQNFNWIGLQMKNFPIDPHCKKRPLSATL